MSYGNLEIETGGSKYLKISSGRPVDIHVLTKSENVKKKYVHYDGTKYNDCQGSVCEDCLGGLKKEVRYVINVFDRSEQDLKQFEFGPNIAIGIREIARALELDGQTIHDVDLRISRVSDKPVRYQVVQRKMAGSIQQEILDQAEVPF